jgi:CheY-like chemotaxis protein
MSTQNHSLVTLQEPIRVLIIDDKPGDQQAAKEVFESCGLRMTFTFASLYDDALEKLCYQYVDIAVVDLVLHPGPPGPQEDWEGFDLLQELLERGLHQDLVVIVFTAFGREPEVTREAFVTFHVADVWDKSYSKGRLLDSLQRALEQEDYFGLRSSVVFDGDLSWKSLISSLRLPLYQLSSAVEPGEAEGEIRHLLRRLFPKADRLGVAPMNSGGSGAGVIRVTPSYRDGGRAADVIVKYGPIDSLRREYAGWKRVNCFLSGFRSTQILKTVWGRHLGAMEYSLVGANLREVVPFSKYYIGASGDEIRSTLDKLFLETCGLWYQSMTTTGSPVNLADAYGQYLGFSRQNIEPAFRFKYPEWPVNQADIRFAMLPRKMLHPIAEFCQGKAVFSWETAVCLNHGDFHGENIRVDPPSKEAWLIDFGRADCAHWARDFVQLETVIKFQLTQHAELPALFEFEDILSSADDLSQDLQLFRDDLPDLQKAFQSVIWIRRLAAKAAGRLEPGLALKDYFAALFYQTINYVRLHRLIKGGQRKNHVLMSAALVLEKLNSMPE